METCRHSFDGYVRQRRKTCCVGLPPPLIGDPIPIIERARRECCRESVTTSRGRA